MESFKQDLSHCPQQSEYKQILAASVTAAGDYTSDIVLPPGAKVVDVNVTVSEVFNTGGNCTLKVGDTSDDDLFVASTDAKSAVIKGSFLPAAFISGLQSDNTVRLTLNAAASGFSAPSTGIVTFFVSYVFAPSTVYAAPTS